MSESTKRRRQVAILLFDDVEVLDFAGPFEVLSVTSERIGTDRLQVFTVAETDGVVCSIGGLTILPKHSFELSPVPDILIVPGGTGSRREMDNRALVAWVKRVHRDAELVMSVCSGARILARAGLLDGIPVTTHHQVTDHLRELAPAAHVDTARRYIDAGRIMTTGGISAGIDGAFHVVTRLFGYDTARGVAEYMEYDWRPDPLQTPGEAPTDRA